LPLQILVEPLRDVVVARVPGIAGSALLVDAGDLDLSIDRGVRIRILALDLLEGANGLIPFPGPIADGEAIVAGAGFLLGFGRLLLRLLALLGDLGLRRLLLGLRADLRVPHGKDGRVGQEEEDKSALTGHGTSCRERKLSGKSCV